MPSGKRLKKSTNAKMAEFLDVRAERKRRLGMSTTIFEALPLPILAKPIVWPLWSQFTVTLWAK